MALTGYAVARIESVLKTIRLLQGSEFPYRHSKDALDEIETLFTGELNHLKAFTTAANPDVVKQHCAVSLNTCFRYLPLLGFILRSTNVRNAFEVFGPLLDISGRVLEPSVDASARTTKLLLSSEWNYSPITYHEIPDLPGFVLIGFPASESSNPLLMPLSGHELGHSIWAAKDKMLENQFRPSLQKGITDYIQDHWQEYQSLFPNVLAKADLTKDLFARQTWLRALHWAVPQAKESFCDFIGIRIYGTCFLQAFAYLFAPNVHSPRSERYPQSMTRVRNLVRAAETYEVDAPPDYEAMFRPRPEPQLAQIDSFRLRAADEALAKTINELILKADELISQTDLEGPSDREIDRILKQFYLMVPAQHCRCLADILNAAWRAYEDEDLCQPSKAEVEIVKDEVLKDLILKTVEIFEAEQILGQGK